MHLQVSMTDTWQRRHENIIRPKC